MLTKENTFDKIFENPDLTLEALLDHEMILGEFRNQNSKLMALYIFNLFKYGFRYYD